MKKSLILFILALVALTVNAQYNCTVVTSDRDHVTFRVTGYGKNIKIATADAELSAIKGLCFIGASGTSFSMPLISQPQSKIEKEHPDFFNDFYSTSYKNYIETSSVVIPFGKDAAKRKCVTLDVCVRASQLRSFLEKSGIIRKFGL